MQRLRLLILYGLEFFLVVSVRGRVMIDGRVKVLGSATAEIPIMSTLDAAESGRVYDEATAGKSCFGSGGCG